MIVIATGCLWLVVLSASHKLIVRTYLGNAQGTTRGSAMAFDTEHRLIIPSDSTATVETQGVLGPTFVEINTRNKTGAPMGNNGIMESIETAVGKSLLEQSKRLRERDKPVDPAKLGK